MGRSAAILCALLPVLIAVGGTSASEGNRAVRAVSRAPLTIAQLQYDGGGDWYANPSGLPNLMKAISQRLS
ncbi:MAG: hypothetical protein ABIS27_14930, partial [Longimicrobiales bacterium]